MVSLITLAHRVSGIHANYADIHAALFSLSLARVKSQLTQQCPPYSEYKDKLMQLVDELGEIGDSIRVRKEIDRSSTFDREFLAAMNEYVQALAGAMRQLVAICQRRERESKGIEPYDETQSRTDRVAYDQSIQRYQRHGERLGELFERL